MSSEPTEVDPFIVREQQAWHSAESQDYYRRHRRSVGDLYPSERFFLPDVLQQVNSMLDVGCAAGGFSAVVRAINPRVRYVGLDVVPAFVETARTDYPGAEFHVSDGIHFNTPPGSFELVHSTGVLHMNARYKDMIRAMWSQTTRFLLCDLRLSVHQSQRGYVESPFGERDRVTLPYLVINVNESIHLFAELDPAPRSLRIRGYPQEPNAAAHLPDREVFMAFFLAEKGDSTEAPTVDIDLHGRPSE